MFTITNAKDELAGMLHGTSLNKVRNINGVFQRAGRQLVQDCDSPDTKRKALIANALYDRVYDYAAPSDLKGSKIIDIRPQIDRTVADRFLHTYGENFDLSKEDRSFAVESDSLIKTVRVSKSLPGSEPLHECNGISDDGTWSVGGTASGLTEDSVYRVTGSNALKFDLTTGTGYIEIPDMSAVDLSDHEGQSAIFLFIYIPDATKVTSVSLRWGSTSGAYFEKSVTEGHFGAFQTGLNLLRFDWSSATETGTADVAAVDYLRVSITVNADLAGIRIDSIVSKLPYLYELVYYSKCLFRDSNGTWKDTVENDSDLVNLDTDGLNLFITLSAAYALQQQGTASALTEAKQLLKDYKEDLKAYKRAHKSEAKLQIIRYY